MRSLVIEDEPQIGAYLGRLLGQLGGIVDIVETLSDAKQALGNFKYDLAILDRMLPDGDALDIVMALNRLPERPAFIMLTAKDAKEDVIDGLNSGADDYLGKPFEPQEFIARVRAVLRRPRLLVPSRLSFGNVELNVGTNEVTVADNRVLLRRREALILEAGSMTRSSPIPLRRSCPDSAKSWSNLAEMSRFAACGASAIFSGRHKPDDVNHQDTGAFARRDCHRNLSRHARHRYLVRSGARPRAKILPNSLGYPQSRDGRRSRPRSGYQFQRHRGAEIS